MGLRAITRCVGVLLVMVIAASCGGGAGGPSGPTQAVPLLVTAGVRPLPASPLGDAGLVADFSHIAGGGIPTAEFDLTTAPNEVFRFALTALGTGSDDLVRLGVAHAFDGFDPVLDASHSLGSAGIATRGHELDFDGVWFGADGSGTVRVDFEGSVDRDQTLLVEIDNGDGTFVCVINLMIGPESEINPGMPDERPSGGPALDLYPGISLTRTVHTAQALAFGAPALAGTDGRYTTVFTESMEGLPGKNGLALGEQRLVYDRTADSVELAPPAPRASSFIFDSRSRALAFQGDTLVIVRADNDGASAQMSADNGATFGDVTPLTAGDHVTAGLPQAAFGPDGALAVAFWRWTAEAAGGGDPGRADPGQDLEFPLDLILVEGAPDENGAYAFGEPQQLFRGDGRDVTPALVGLAYSSAGDLVLGYAFTRRHYIEEELSFGATTENHCVTRLAGAEPRDVLVESSEIVGFDPSVAVLGSGEDMRVFFAYEGPDGVRLRTSADAGANFSEPSVAPSFAGHMPEVFARTDGAAIHVDLLYLAITVDGQELRYRRWEDFDSGAPADFRLSGPTPTQAEAAQVGPDDLSEPTPAQTEGAEVGPYGYDAIQNGTEIIVALHEVTLGPLPSDPVFGEPSLDHTLKIVVLE